MQLSMYSGQCPSLFSIFPKLPNRTSLDRHFIILFFILSTVVLFPCSHAVYAKTDKRECFDADKSLEVLESFAEVILTGTIDSIKPEVNDYSEVGRVKIKRVIKNPERLADRKWITVHGLNDPTVCDSVASVHDTKIFLLHQTAYGDFRLNSSLIPITLRNLDALEAAVQGKADAGYVSDLKVSHCPMHMAEPFVTRLSLFHTPYDSLLLHIVRARIIKCQ